MNIEVIVSQRFPDLIFQAISMFRTILGTVGIYGMVGLGWERSIWERELESTRKYASYFRPRGALCRSLTAIEAFRPPFGPLGLWGVFGYVEEILERKRSNMGQL